MAGRGPLVFAYALMLCASLSSCAGPHGPFGAKAWPELKASPELILAGALLDEGSNLRAVAAQKQQKQSQISIEFSPNYQSLHESRDLSVVITDPGHRVLPDQVRFLYGEEDVTSLWRDQALREVHSDGETLVFTLSKARFLAGLEKPFMVAYKRELRGDYAIAKLQSPICPIDELAAIANPRAFKGSAALLPTIERESNSLGINPNLLAALVAQESGYNPKAVSIAKAIGLTQVSSIASIHVVPKLEDAVSFPGIEGLSYPELLFKVYSGEINSENEWRLHPVQSLRGGLHYLQFLKSYWSAPQSKRELDLIYPTKIPWEDILLASYNSGPYRVKRAIQSHGKNWSYHPKLKEARKYVSKVRSYCQNFATK